MNPMELLFILLVAAIGGAMIRIDYTLTRVNRNLEEIARSLRPRSYETDRADQP
jgi:hypothetical protein